MEEWESPIRPSQVPICKETRRPANADDAAERIRKFVVQLFMRDDGDGVDWSSPIIAEALFKLAFYAIDRMPGGQRVIACCAGSRWAPMTVLTVL